MQHQFDTINAVSDTAFKVVDGLIKLTEDIVAEKYNKNAYTFAGATPAEITHLNDVTHSIQAQFDDGNNEFNAINTELNYCIKCSINRLKNDVTLNSGHMLNVVLLLQR